MVYADEVAPAEEIPELAALEHIDVSDRELTMAKSLIESLSTDFEPEKFRDTYRDRVLDLIERKAAGDETVVEAPAAPDESKVVDLMAALEASVKEAREARKRHPAATDAAEEASPAPKLTVAGKDGADDEDAGEAPAKPKRKPAKRTRKSA
jgi:DNA end-binding protein Ku